MKRLLVTIDSLRYDYLKHMPRTESYLDTTHDRAFSACTATMGSFPATIGGEYPDGTGLHPGSSLANHMDRPAVGITTNHLLSAEYGYDEGFDRFHSPKGGGESLKDKGAIFLTQGTLPYKAAVWGWNQYQQLQSRFGSVPKSFRRAEAVVEEFRTHVEDEDDWFGWLHLMEPHHPYDPDDSPVSRAEAQAVSRRVVGGGGTEAEKELTRELYRREVEELDEKLAPLWEFVPDDARVVFCADHGELLGEDDLWGHPGVMREELLNVPFGTRNAPDLGDVVSLVDVPTVLRGEEHGQGTLDRDVAFATYGDEKAAVNADHIVNSEGTRTLWSDESAEDPSLEREYERFEPGRVDLDDALMEDLEDLGYA
ncbi:sulfatase-like hydrolase/transferase [Halobium salinum]|uniref:Sulfatase-like hydrolase/transferase n=1 Tax=Halobium salinum TaxID=1364940 RepID=A0ABD5P6H2_9EURY|nr:sulfatase-like hydrolase/transferase [Halobium salinum]